MHLDGFLCRIICEKRSVKKVGIIGAGRIAENMAKTLDGMDDAAAYAIAARNLDRAQKFAKEWGFEKAYGSYKELVNDPEVELIYIATPHPFHIEQTLYQSWETGTL